MLYVYSGVYPIIHLLLLYKPVTQEQLFYIYENFSCTLIKKSTMVLIILSIKKGIIKYSLTCTQNLSKHIYIS